MTDEDAGVKVRYFISTNMHEAPSMPGVLLYHVRWGFRGELLGSHIVVETDRQQAGGQRKELQLMISALEEVR